MLLYTNFMRWEVGFPPKYFVVLLQLFKAATIWYFSQVRDYCPSIWGELKWSHLSTEVTAASRNVFCGAAGRHLSSTQRPVSVSGCPLSVFCYWVPPFPTCFPLYKRDFFPPRDELWLVLNVLGVKHPVFLWVIWPSQRPTAFPNDIMGFSWELLEKSDYGSQGTSACPLYLPVRFFWRCWKRSPRVCVIFAQKRGLAN